MRIFRLCLTVILPLSLAGCADPKAEELSEANTLIWDLSAQCLRDTQSAPAEHSMHCIEAARAFFPRLNAESEREEDVFDNLRIHCRENESDECAQYSANMSHTHGLYWKAVAQSIGTFGIPENKLKSNMHGEIGYYQAAYLMQEHFDQCLELYPNPKRPEWLDRPRPKSDGPPVPEAPWTEENTKCIGLGKNKPPVLPD